MSRTALVALALLCAVAPLRAQEPCDGETLISPLYSNDTFLIDMDLNVLQTWHCSNLPGFFAYLLADGGILRPCTVPGGYFYGGGLGGRIERYDAEDNLIWDYLFANNDYGQHHDIEPMPNGNILLIAWEHRSQAQAIAAGRVNLWGEMWPTAIFEIEPEGATGGNIIWEWHLWDHLIQDVDPSKDNYGVVGDHPELLDINLGTVTMGDWVHANAVDYNPELDQIAFTSHYLDELYVIDHSTTTAEAAGHTGGNSGMGGDILYRWGNPQNYDAGDEGDRIFFVVHGVNWIEPGYPGAGHLIVFNNGDRPGASNDYSSIEEIAAPLNGYTYDLEPGEAYGPNAPIWYYADPGTFYSGHWSGVYRLPNGNTLITESETGYVFEVTDAGETVWDYHAPGTLARAPRFNMTGSAVEPEMRPRPYRLLQNYPNPFRLETRIPFQLQQGGRVQVEILDLNGRRIIDLVDATFENGRHEITWKGRDARGREVASSTYLIRMRVNETVQAERLLMLR